MNGKEIRITFDARMAEMSGIGRYIRNILPYLCDEFSMTVLSAYGDSLHYLKDKDFTRKQLKSKIYTIKEQTELPAAVDRCDIFWSPHYNVPLLPVRADRRITSIHDVCPLTEHCHMSPLKRFYAETLIKKAVRSSDIILTGSRFAGNELIARTDAGSDKIHNISLGVDTNRFSRNNDSAANRDVRDKYHLPERFILYVGNVKPHKNIGNLLRAVSGDKDIGVVIAGKSTGFITEDKSIAAILAHNPELAARTVFTGQVTDDELISLYCAATTFVFPSMYEGFGLPALEAQACGCPVVSSSAASMPEVGGDSFFYFDPADISDIRRAVRNVIDNSSLREALISRGYENTGRFSWDKTAQASINAIYSLF